MSWAAHFPEKTEVVDCGMPKSQYVYKQACISFFVNHGTQVLNTSVLLALYEVLGNIFTPNTLN